MMDSEDIWRRMVSGEDYDATHPALIRRLEITREKLWRFNALNPNDKASQWHLLDELLGSHGDQFQFNQPFRCDYGANIHIGECFFANFNLTILDEAEVRCGNCCFVGPNVSIYTACHPLDPAERNKAVEWAEPVTIGDNVWIGGSVTICPGVTIGDNVTIGAGSVVTRDIPSDSVAVGNPARVIRHINKGFDKPRYD